jgi:hypothetical protein
VRSGVTIRRVWTLADGPEGLGQAHGKRLWSGWRGLLGWVSYDRIGYHGGFHPTSQR